VKRVHKLVLILLALLLQVFWFARPHIGHGSVIEESYRRSERLEANRAWFEHPSPATKAAADEEGRRLYDYIGKRNAAVFVSLLIVNGIGICYLWNYGARKTTA